MLPHKKRKLRSFRTRMAAILLLLSLALLLVPLPSALGFGDFDIDSDSGGSDSGGSDWDISGRHSSRRSGRSEPVSCLEVGETLLILAFVLGFLMVPLAFLSMLQQKRKRFSDRKAVQNYYASLNQHAKTYLPSEAEQRELEARIKDLFIRMDEAWEAGNMDNLMKDFTLPAWTYFNAQLQLKNVLHQQTCATKPSYFDAAVRAGYIEGTKEILHVCIRASRRIWTADARTKRIISGNMALDRHICYDWKLVRPVGGISGAPFSDHCPNCGAQVDPSTFAQCPHCGTTLVYPGSDWQISTICSICQPQTAEALAAIR